MAEPWPHGEPGAVTGVRMSSLGLRGSVPLLPKRPSAATWASIWSRRDLLVSRSVWQLVLQHSGTTDFPSLGCRGLKPHSSSQATSVQQQILSQHGLRLAGLPKRSVGKEPELKEC